MKKEFRSGLKTYKEIKKLGTRPKSNFQVWLDDKANNYKNDNVFWFNNPKLTALLATDVEVSLGTVEHESVYFGVEQINIPTQKSTDTITVTFIETQNGDIMKSYKACYDKIFTRGTDNSIGSINTPNNYFFLLYVYSSGDLVNSYKVCVKEAQVEYSTSAVSEISKVTVTFLKLATFI